MVRKMERKSARILAFLLALIMLGSVFAYMMKGGPAEHRPVSYRLDDFRSYVNWTPDGAYYIQYFNFTYLAQLESNDPMKNYIDSNLQDVLIGAVFSRAVLEMTSGISKIFVVNYMTAIPLYFVDANMGKIYFAKEDEVKYGNFTLQVRKGGIALVDRTSPIILGYKPLVERAIDVIEGKNVSAGNETYQYLSRINGSFAYAFFMYGESARASFKSGNESVADFFFEGYRYNFTNNSYEKVWALHFIGNYFFGKMNESEKNFEYYKVKNFGDGLSIAVMEDKDFTKVVNAQPNILSWKISFNTTQNEG
ncbi:MULTISPECIES: hypothetical protein [unclassified Archaeoglobus]|uniref:hypothetical protein n=1 Tax=unclassified Archaeoglobus TaxID=2643606 RepID=UPI0025C47ED9|nr:MULTISPECIES: hypothetical protein [unclassified Archaeoglobus]